MEFGMNNIDNCVYDTAYDRGFDFNTNLEDF